MCSRRLPGDRRPTTPIAVASRSARDASPASTANECAARRFGVSASNAARDAGSPTRRSASTRGSAQAANHSACRRRTRASTPCAARDAAAAARIRLEQREPWLAIALGDHAHEANLLQAPEVRQGIGDLGDRGRRWLVKPACEGRQRLEHGPVLGGHQSKRRVDDDLQAHVAGLIVIAAEGQLARLKPAQDRRRPEQPRPRCPELERERQPVEPAADLHDRAPILIRQGAEAPAFARTCEEQAARSRALELLGRRRQLQGIEGDDNLALDTEPQAARTEHPRSGSPADQVGDEPAGADHLLQVVEDEYRVGPANLERDRLGERNVGGFADVEGRRDGVGHACGIRHVGEVDEPAATASGERPPEDLPREPGLAGAAEPRDGHEPSAGEGDLTAATSRVRPIRGSIGDCGDSGSIRLAPRQGTALAPSPHCGRRPLPGARNHARPLTRA